MKKLKFGNTASKFLKYLFLFVLNGILFVGLLLIILHLWVASQLDGYSYKNNVAEIHREEKVTFNKWKMVDEEFFFVDHSQDSVSGTSIIKFIDSFAIKNSYLYAIGEMGYSRTNLNSLGEIKYVHEGIVEGSLKEFLFDAVDEMPRYLKLDPETANEEWFYSLDEMGAEDREIFENLPPVQFDKRGWNPFR